MFKGGARRRTGDVWEKKRWLMGAGRRAGALTRGGGRRRRVAGRRDRMACVFVSVQGAYKL
jgi:hypothetical protein